MDKFLTFHDKMQTKIIDIYQTKYEKQQTFEPKEPKILWVLSFFICILSVIICRYIPAYLNKDTDEDTLKICMQIWFCPIYADILTLQMITCKPQLINPPFQVKLSKEPNLIRKQQSLRNQFQGKNGWFTRYIVLIIRFTGYTYP